MKIITSCNYDNIIKKEASGLSSVFKHMIDGGSFGIVSAMDDSLKSNIQGIHENNKKDRLLKQLLRKFDIGYIRLKGMWKDEKSQKYLAEKSVFIPHAKEEDVRTLAELFNQDSYIYGKNGFFSIKKTDGSATYLTGDIKDYLRQVSPFELKSITDHPENAKIPGASVAKGRGFVFDGDKKLEKSVNPLEISV